MIENDKQPRTCTGNPVSQFLDAAMETVLSYRKMIEAAAAQLTDAELNMRPNPQRNSVAVIIRHIGGNLQSRWTDFLSTDGEKPDRNREVEFTDWKGSREELLDYSERGWNAITSALRSINESNLSATIYIRGETHTIAQAVTRSITHIAYHAGQITMTAREVHQGEWKWLTISPGKSAEFNEKNWGSSESRSILGEK